MKVPKYIEKALERRARAAEAWNHNDLIVSNFIDKHDIFGIDECDYHSGVEAIVNPWASSQRVYKAIKAK